MKLIFVRHGKDDNRYRGGWSNLDLIPEGMEQAKQLAQYLKDNNQDYLITHIISSDLPRTMSTAHFISSELGLPIQKEFRIREIDNGDLAGMLNDTALALFGAVLFILGLIVNLEYIPNFSAKTLPTWFNWGIIGVSVALLMIAFGTKSKRPIDLPRKSSKLSKRTVSMAIMVLLAIPVTIFVGMTYLQDQKYLFISLLVMIECMIPFFLVFEGRHPKARELVIISVLCAIAVAGRLAFTMLPQFKPVVAIVIISGVAFGGESGFLVGAVSMLVSNLMFGQGPWTPWQMFAAGIIGFIGGILFKKGLLGRTRTSLCIYGFIATMVIYGGLMNLYSALTSHSAFNLNMLITFYVQGFPMDIVHAVSTVIFLFFGAEPMLEKLDRIKVKYGLIE